MPLPTPTARFSVKVQDQGHERREFRRHDLEQQELAVDRWDGNRRLGKPLGKLVDLSAGGIRVRTNGPAEVRPDSQIRVKLALPAHAGISPFIDTTAEEPTPKREWIGWMTVARVIQVDDKHTDIAGRLVDMEEMDRGMLSLYLSTQPMAA